MKTPADELASVLERLAEKVEELEARLSILERRSDAANSLAGRPASSAAVPANPLDDISFPRPTGVMPAVGKVFLGVAGAYLLRAVAESGSLPRLAVVAVALVYAGMWLVWAAGTRAGAVAGTAYAVTAALILSPMLWEVTLRFRVLPEGATAAVLAAFAVLASALAWKRNLTSVVWAATFCAAATALALLVATRNPAPFVVALLVMALTTEAVACRGRWLSMRPVVAVAGDLAFVALISVYTRQDGPPPEYQPIATGALLALLSAWFAVYAAGAVFRTAGSHREISLFEIGQTTTAFLLTAMGILRISHGAGAYALGTFCLLAAAGCYWAAWLRFERIPQPRNYHVFATWAAALLLTGSFLCFRPVALAPELSVAALAAAFASVRSRGATLGFHAAAYLGSAAFVSGLLNYAGGALAGSLPPAPGWLVWVAALSAVLCYGMVWRTAPELGSPTLRDPWKLQLPWFLIAAVAAGALTALCVVAIVWLAPGGTTESAARLAVIRTAVIGMAALALAWGSSRGKRIELVWLTYVAIALCTVKLLFEDLRYGSAGSVALSLFFYGMVWVLAPRLLRRSPR
jgi:hypothetical protein